MANGVDLAGLAAVMALSLALALGLEWLCVRGVFLLLPSANARRSMGRAATPAAMIRAMFPRKGLSRLGQAGLDR